MGRSVLYTELEAVFTTAELLPAADRDDVLVTKVMEEVEVARVASFCCTAFTANLVWYRVPVF